MTYDQLRAGMFVRSSLTDSVYRIVAVLSAYSNRACVARMERVFCGNGLENTIAPCIPESTFSMYGNDLPRFHQIDEFEVQLLQLDISQK